MLKKIIIGIFAVIGISAIAVVGCSMMAIETIDNAIEETERQYVEDSNEIQKMANQIVWTKNGEELIGEFVNTSDKTIGSIDAQVKFYNNEEVVIGTDTIIENGIAPNETRTITLYLYGYADYSSLEVIVDNEWSHFE